MSSASRLPGYIYDPNTLKITSPGKFEGCPRWAPAFWAIAQEDGSSGPTWSCYVTARDCRQFRELHGFYQINMWEDDQGFIHAEAIPEPPGPEARH